MSEKVLAEWCEDYYAETPRSKKAPAERFSFQTEGGSELFKKLSQKASVWDLTDELRLKLGWNLNGFQIAHASSYVQFYDWDDNQITCSIHGDAVEISFIGNARGVLKTFFANFWAYVFPETKLAFEDLTAEEKLWRVEARRLEEQKLRAEAEKRWNEEQELAKKQRLLDSFTPLDYEILKMRKAGNSYWAICKKLNVSMSKVQHKLRVMSMIPKLTKDWPLKLQPLTRDEWLASLKEKAA